MFIKITRDIVDAAIGGDEMALNLLRDMDFACHHGKHLFMGDQETLVLIKERFAETYQALAKLFANISTLGAIVNFLKWHVEFALDQEESYVKDVDGKNVIVISKNDISLFQTFNECHLLVENLEDVHMYQHILDFYKRDKNIMHTFNNYYSVLGGGSTTAKVMKHEMESRHFLILCIVDSDKTYSEAQIKRTAQKVQEIYDACSYKYNTCLYVLKDVMEVESLVPLNTYEEYCTPVEGDGSKKELHVHFQLIKSIKEKNEGYLDFFDFKIGLQSSHLVDESPQNTNRKIIESIAAQLNNPVLPNSERYKKILDVLSAEELALSPQDQEKLANKCMGSETYVPGLGKDILRKVLESCSDSLKKITKEQLSKTQHKIFEEIGGLMYCWTCAIEPQRL